MMLRLLRCELMNKYTTEFHQFLAETFGPSIEMMEQSYSQDDTEDLERIRLQFEGFQELCDAYRAGLANSRVREMCGLPEIKLN